MHATATELDRARRLPPFAEASKKSLSMLFADAVAHDFAESSVLYRQGDAPKYLHVLLAGLVGVHAVDNRANEYLLDFFWPGQSFVLPAVVLDRPYTFSAKTLADSRVLMMPAKTVRACLRKDVAFSFAVNKLLSEQRGSLAAHVRSLKTQSPAERLAVFLLSLTDRRQGEATIVLPCERRMIGWWLGVVPSSTSRAFRELEKNCGVEGRGRQLRIPSVECLVKRAGLLMRIPAAAAE